MPKVIGLLVALLGLPSGSAPDAEPPTLPIAATMTPATSASVTAD